MKILNSIDNSHIFVEGKDKKFELKYLKEVKKGQKILLSSGLYTIISDPYLSINLEEGTLELEVEQIKEKR